MSTNHVVRSLLEERYSSGPWEVDRKVDPTTKPCPLSHYGMSKAACEQAGAAAVEAGEIESFVSLRIGSVTRDDTPLSDVLGQRIWISRRDLADLILRIVAAPPSGFHQLFASGAQSSSPFDLTPNQTLVGWRPRDSVQTMALGADR